MSFIKHLYASRRGNLLLGMIFIISPMSFNYSLNSLALSQSLTYKPKEISFDYFEITRPSKRRGIVLYENGKKKKTISLSNRIAAADIYPYQSRAGVASYIELDVGSRKPRHRLLAIRIAGIYKEIGHTRDLPDKQERIASARKFVGYSILLLTICVILMLYTFYQFMKNSTTSPPHTSSHKDE